MEQMQKIDTEIEKLVTIGSRNIPLSLRKDFMMKLTEEKIGQQAIFLLWIVKLFVARPKIFVQMMRDLEKEIDEEKLNLTH
jgi:hypothetical protein